ncbi:FtsX-like permease family protein [Latilactobacillus fuchuensis]|uniref:Peptide ABC transporter permease n=1 Tax=Latilactobacillus fuchuensis TaxID=164393 RepID=A0A2N9DT22_9LACO|nr:FtsX-like permease family protein [Latilactobacillus fuchuensis]SPC35909.1 Peptide ABC transporter permease [Latilactobacillus fuchuensis]
MLWKLSLTGIKGRFKDYFVLFSGLIMASAIFYMFEAMAMNKDFVSGNSPVGMAAIIFQIGSVLLGMIALVYVMYANSFLMTMRRRDYGMFMMLGAKGRKIAQLIATETIVIGTLATLVGTVLGVGLTQVVSQFLIKRLDAVVTHFSPLYWPAVLVTLVFFIVLFIIAAVVNQFQLLKTPVLRLLHDDQQPNRVRNNPWWTAIQIILGLSFIAIGYLMMIKFASFLLPGLVVALFTITSGTYMLFNAFFGWLIKMLKKSSWLTNRGLNNFTLAQLGFRIKDYTRILALVAMLFALALGSITVGIGYQSEIPKMASATSAYDVVLNQPTKAAQKKAAQLTGIEVQATYHTKEIGQTIYYQQAEFVEEPLLKQVYSKSNGGLSMKLPKTEEMSIAELTKQIGDGYTVRSLQVPDQFAKQAKLVSETTFDQLQGTTKTVQVYRVADFAANLPLIKQLDRLQIAANPSLQKNPELNSGKYAGYTMLNGLFSGFEFMGFFLGIAFLAMLASCLMFKILSGAASDVKRYTMLDKIGTRQGLLRQSIAKEIGVLFLLPGIVGVIHVLFGLQLFKTIMLDPYHNLWLPFGIFIVLYGLYYVLTTWLYQGIVLKKRD